MNFLRSAAERAVPESEAWLREFVAGFEKDSADKPAADLRRDRGGWDEARSTRT